LDICKRIGLPIPEMKYLTIGQVQDLIVEYVKANDTEHQKSKGVRQATQADFDAF